MNAQQKKEERTSEQFVLVGVHKVNGDALAIKYLQDTTPRYAEGLFFLAKRSGSTRFEWTGDVYEIKRNSDLSFTLVKTSSAESKSFDTFKK